MKGYDFLEKRIEFALDYVNDKSVSGLKLAARMEVKTCWLKLYGEQVKGLW